jgi:hypothetical protein
MKELYQLSEKTPTNLQKNISNFNKKAQPTLRKKLTKFRTITFLRSYQKGK